VTTCQIVDANISSPYAYLWDAKTAAMSIRIANDWNTWLACNGASGATIINSLWQIHPDDDDATLVLSLEADTAGVVSVMVSGGTADRSYRLVNTVTSSDGQVPIATGQIPVRETYKQALAA